MQAVCHRDLVAGEEPVHLRQPRPRHERPARRRPLHAAGLGGHAQGRLRRQQVLHDGRGREQENVLPICLQLLPNVSKMSLPFS